VVKPVTFLCAIDSKSCCCDNELCQANNRVEVDDYLFFARGVSNAHLEWCRTVRSCCVSAVVLAVRLFVDHRDKQNTRYGLKFEQYRVDVSVTSLKETWLFCDRSGAQPATISALGRLVG